MESLPCPRVCPFSVCLVRCPCKAANDEYMRELYHPKGLHSGVKMSNEIHVHTWKPMRLINNMFYYLKKIENPEICCY
jgi:hypothetical protein